MIQASNEWCEKMESSIKNLIDKNGLREEFELWEKSENRTCLNYDELKSLFDHSEEVRKKFDPIFDQLISIKLPDEKS